MTDPTQAKTAAPPAARNAEHPYRYTAALADEIETRWQQYWDQHGTFRTPNPGDEGFDHHRPKFFVLDMFPYPSGAGLHVGHPEGYTATDIIARYKRHRGFNVLHPMGWDAFGLPAEQYAIQTNVHPAITTKQAIGTFRRQLSRFGFSYDWSREFATIDSEYYRWTQWIWLKAYHSWYDPRQKDGGRARPIEELVHELENGHIYVDHDGDLAFPPGLASELPALSGPPVGVMRWQDLSPAEERAVIDNQRLAYLSEQIVNWCPKLGTVLANEEVIDGRSERGSHPVYRRPLRQWMFRITAYAERLLRDLELVEWPESTRIMQAEWIGRSEGAVIDFPLVPRLSEPGVGGAGRTQREIDTSGSESGAAKLSSWLDLIDIEYAPEISAEGFEPRDPFPRGEPSPSDLLREERFLPHLELPGATYFVTWRCVKGKMLGPKERDEALQALTHWDGERCQVFATVVMPDHVHWIVRPYEEHTLSDLVESVKRYSARQINAHRGEVGSMWEAERFDRIVRDIRWLAKFIFYVLRNPVVAGLVERPSEYEWISLHSGVKTVDGIDVLEAANEIESTTPGSESRGTSAGAIRVYTTRPDTVFGATYMVLAPEHPLVDEILENPRAETNVDALRSYVERARNRSEIERQESKEKTGVFTGAYAINPATSERIPVWVADYVLMGYGHGAIMAVPGHDERDFEFAKIFNLPISRVVRRPDESPDAPLDEAFEDDGVGCNSADDHVSLNDLPTPEAKHRIIEWLEKTGIGDRKVNFRLRDWLFSRQRYWGEPFPIVYDEAGNHYAVGEEHLPVTLPDLEDFHPIESDEPTPLLAKAAQWLHTTAGEAGVPPDVLAPETPVRRETNTMPGWAGSCWYYLRFCDPRNDNRLVGRDAERYWMGADGRGRKPAVHGVDLYIGGAEHAVLHLLYARFWHKMLYDLGEVSTPEPFAKLFHQGIIVSFAYQREDRTLVPTDEVEEREPGVFIERATGKAVTQVTAKMSKSLKNVQNPDDVIAEYGADTFRLYEMYMGPLEASKPWNPRDIAGCYRFLQRAWRLVVDESNGELRLTGAADEKMERLLHRTIAKVGDDIERLAFNTAIAAMIEFVNAATSSGGLARDQLERFAVILSPFAPHMAEELWSKIGHMDSIAYAPWPPVDDAMLREDHIEMPVQILGKVRGHVTVPADADEKRIEQAALAEPKIAAQLQGKQVRKVIVVPGRIVNIIAG
jgi:leucyl-tRNA synthetase